MCLIISDLCQLISDVICCPFNFLCGGCFSGGVAPVNPIGVNTGISPVVV